MNVDWKFAPIKVDVVNGADGFELQEIIESLCFRADSLSKTNPFHAAYLQGVAKQYEKLYEERRVQLLHFLLTRGLPNK